VFKDVVAEPGGGEGDAGESSGFAILSPPRVSDKLRSPFMMEVVVGLAPS
jgi:hypothetical protein